jgi:signal transduction histidine kinase
VRLPPLFRTTPFRMTVLFVAVFAFGAAAFLAYIYGVTAWEVRRVSGAGIAQQFGGLEKIYHQGGRPALIEAMQRESGVNSPLVLMLLDPSGHRIWGNIAQTPAPRFNGGDTVWMRFKLSAPSSGPPSPRAGERLARAEWRRLKGGELLLVGADVSDAESYVLKIVRALWGAGALVIVLGLAGGLVVSRNVTRAAAELNATIGAVRGGDLGARAKLRGARDEFEDLAVGLNDMLDRLQRSIGGLRHAGDAIAHDLRSPLTRLRARLEVSLLDLEAGRGDPKAAIAQALADTEGVLSTFATVLAIARLEAAGAVIDPRPFDSRELAADVADLYEPVCEERGLEFHTDLAPGLHARGNREFVAQALANLLDNAIKYTPSGGDVTLQSRKRISGEVEFSVTDTGPGVPRDQRARIVERFVRLENSRNQPGAGLGLSLVAAVAEAHGGRLELQDGGAVGDTRGRGLKAALVLPGVD